MIKIKTSSCILRLTALLLFSQSVTVRSQNLSVESHGQLVQVSLNNMLYPSDIVTAELRSGLPHRFMVFLSVVDGRKPVADYHIVKVVRYDLWDEKFLVETVADGNGGNGGDVSVFSNLEDLEASLKIFTFRKIELPRSKPTEEYTLKAHVVFNPVSKEQTEKIQQWISRGRARSRNIALANSQQAAANVDSVVPQPASANVDSAVPQPSSSRLLDSFITNSIYSDQLGADWKSKVFTIKWTPLNEQ